MRLFKGSKKEKEYNHDVALDLCDLLICVEDDLKHYKKYRDLYDKFTPLMRIYYKNDDGHEIPIGILAVKEAPTEAAKETVKKAALEAAKKEGKKFARETAIEAAMEEGMKAAMKAGIEGAKKEDIYLAFRGGQASEIKYVFCENKLVKFPFDPEDKSDWGRVVEGYFDVFTPLSFHTPDMGNQPPMAIEFMDLVGKIENFVDQYKDHLYIGGHSLGGTLSVLTVAQLSLSKRIPQQKLIFMYNFGCPYFCDQKFVNYFSQIPNITSFFFANYLDLATLWNLHFFPRLKYLKKRIRFFQYTPRPTPPNNSNFWQWILYILAMIFRYLFFPVIFIIKFVFLAFHQLDTYKAYLEKEPKKIAQ